MIRGQVNADREATLSLELRGPRGAAQEVEVVVDTGFNGFLVLPRAVVSTLGLVPLAQGRAVLADGRESVFSIYEVTVVWDGQAVAVEAGVLDAALVGMSLLYGQELRVHRLPHGDLPRPEWVPARDANREEIEDDIAKEVAEADRLEREGLIVR